MRVSHTDKCGGGEGGGGLYLHVLNIVLYFEWLRAPRPNPNSPTSPPIFPMPNTFDYASGMHIIEFIYLHTL